MTSPSGLIGLKLILLPYLCKRFKIKMIQSRPYNMKAHRKVERSDKEFRQKIYYVMVNLKDKVVN